MATANSMNMDSAGVQSFATATGDLSGSAITQYAVLAGGASNSISSIGPGNSGQILQSAGGASNPAYSTATYPSASGSSGKVLISDGTNNVYSTPTFPNASATSGKIIKSDGTNWTASTETYAAPGTSGNVMVSDGTNWTSTGLLSGLTYVTLNITSTQIKALRATPQQVVAAPAAGKVLAVVGPIYGKFNYGGSNVFTVAGGLTIGLAYASSTTAVVATACTNAVLGGSTSSYVVAPTLAISGALASYAAQPLNLFNPGGGEIGGNAANNNTFTVSFMYYTITLT